MPSLEPEPASAANVTPKPGVWQVAVVLAVAAVLSMLTGTAVLVVLLLMGAVSLRDLASPGAVTRAPYFLPAAILATELSFLAAALVPKLLNDAPTGLAERLHWRLGRVRWVEVALLTLGLLGLGHSVQALAELLGLWGGRLQAVNEAVAELRPAGFAALLLGGALGAGVAEELLFRGVAQTRLVERWGPARGIFGAALLFGLAHMDPLHTPLAFLMGVLMGRAAWRSGTIVTGVIAHTVNNALSFFLSWRGYEVPSSDELAGVVAGSVVVLACVVALHRRWATTRPT